MKLEADPRVCIGAGNCVLADETLFDQTDDGTVVLLRTPGPGDEATVRRAVALCPSRALRVTEPLGA